jgi:drug/metabolite transporter (DMT)-like permease
VPDPRRCHAQPAAATRSGDRAVSPVVVAAVLLAAVLHASWNAVTKHVTGRVDLFARSSLVGFVLAAPLVALLAPPARAAWPWLAASAGVHIVYNGGLLAAYRRGTFNQAYPIARGLGPLLVAAVAAITLGESPRPAPATGILLIAGALAVLGLVPWRQVRADPRAVLLAAGTGVTIAAYTVVDGVGVRASGSAGGYTAWLFATHSLATAVALALARRGRARDAPLLRVPARAWGPALAVSAMSMGAYGLVLWAQTRGALAAVAALRESSVVVAALIGAVVFGEPMGRARVLASTAIAAGALLVALPVG